MDAGSNGIIFDDLSDPKPGFQGHCILRSRISQKRCNLGTNLLKNTNIWNHIGLHRMVPLDLEWPLTPISRSRRFSTLNISETTRDRVTSMGSRMRSIINSDIFNDLDGPLTRFSRSRRFWSRISQKRAFRYKVSIEH